MIPPLPKDFRFAAVHCGLKSDASKLDLSLIVSDTPAVAAGVYTQNLVHAACVAVNRELTPGEGFRAVVVNSGNANACTGERGVDDTKRMARLAGEAIGADEDQTLVLSTGIIGEFLPMDKIAKGIEAAAGRLAAGEDALVEAACGMMTTDTVHKVAGRTVELSTGAIQITGMAKGAAMIGPNMATMLGVIFTDARLDAPTAQQSLRTAVDDSFNCISVEGHMSTNDTVLLLANGAACADPLSGDDLAVFQAALDDLCIELAKAIPADGEGTTHLVDIEIRGCDNQADARQIAKTVAESVLVKTAIAGADPNWGRIVSAAGYAGVAFDPARVDLHVNGTPLYEQGAPVAFDAATVSESIRANRQTDIVLQFGEGEAVARFWTTDLTAEYVRLNADYHT